MSATIFVFSNNASSLLPSAITNSQTSIPVASGYGAEFPAIGAGQAAPLVCEDVSGNWEVMYLTGLTGDNLTVLRGQEGTTPLAFASGSRIECRLTMGVIQQLLQKTGGDTLSGTTTLSGSLSLGAGGSINSSGSGGEIAGLPLRGAPGQTSNQILIPNGGGPATEGGSVILTSANLASNLPAGSALAVTGMIVAWNGSTSSIPSGWVLCDGSNGSPDLRDRFIIGGGGSLPSPGTYSATTDPTSAGTPVVSGGTITAANLPKHTHGSTIYGGSAGQTVGPTGQAAGGAYFFGGSGTGVAINWVSDGGTGLSNTPTPLNFTGTALPTHTHTIETPPYTALVFIMKT